jgi:hypothetical protein
MIRVFLFSLLIVFPAYSETVMDKLSDEEEIPEISRSLAQEKIQRMSYNKGIIILSNENQGYNQGDFITLLQKGKPIARALVAKTKGNLSGIKIIKIYSQTDFDSFAVNQDVQIVRGDDSAYFKTEKSEKGKLKEQEEGQFDKTMISEEELLEKPRTNYLISNNFIFEIGVGSVEGIDILGGSKRYAQINFQLSYQVARNFFFSAVYGQNTIKSFPNTGLDTRYYQINGRAKYTLPIFWTLLLQPYVGFQYSGASSPGAGQPDGVTTQAQLNYEVAMVNQLHKQKFIFGLSLFVTIVPSWYLIFDIGTDMGNLALGLDF